MKPKLLPFYLFIFMSLAFTFSASSQVEGDTIRIQTFNFNSISRDSLVSFPDLPEVNFRKILLKYTLRCKEGLVSTPSDRNKGCGEWDYSCNTYIADSSKIEAV